MVDGRRHVLDAVDHAPIPQSLPIIGRKIVAGAGEFAAGASRPEGSSPQRKETAAEEMKTNSFSFCCLFISHGRDGKIGLEVRNGD